MDNFRSVRRRNQFRHQVMTVNPPMYCFSRIALTVWRGLPGLRRIYNQDNQNPQSSSDPSSPSISSSSYKPMSKSELSIHLFLGLVLNSSSFLAFEASVGHFQAVVFQFGHSPCHFQADFPFESHT
ncbi:hypothetical protein M9H77_25699 [Catharanthus roseus]|uniref:Uncharacterized protein n=1 Tax=Catharanthus roseus TaxID=4058 RepID=A0ACC0A806_CATRO|nr:hypothetical protein M9H77_25699 [Catharanthus roseus]